MRITIEATAALAKGDLVTSAGAPAAALTDDIAGVAIEDYAIGEEATLETSGKVRVRVGAGGAGLTAGQPVAASVADADGSVETIDVSVTLGGAPPNTTIFLGGVALEAVAAGEEGYVSVGVYTASN